MTFRAFSSLKWAKGLSQKTLRGRYRDYRAKFDLQQAPPESAPAVDESIQVEIDALLPRTRLAEEISRPLLASYVAARRNLEAALKSGRTAEKEATTLSKLGEHLGFTSRQVPESGDRVGRLSVLQSIAQARASARWSEIHEAERQEAAALTARLATGELSKEESVRLGVLTEALKPDAVGMAALYREAFADLCREYGEEIPDQADVRWWRP